MTKDDVIKAYVRMREIDNTIPNKVLDLMKNSALEALEPQSNVKFLVVVDNDALSCSDKYRVFDNHDRAAEWAKKNGFNDALGLLSLSAKVGMMNKHQGNVNVGILPLEVE